MLSIEAFVITNFAMNLLVLSVGARAMGHVRWRRVLVASCVGTIYAVTACAWVPQIRGFAAQTLCLLLMSLILFAGRTAGRWLKGFLYIAGSCVFAGGIMALLGRKFPSGSPLMTSAGWLIVAVCAFFRGGTQLDTGRGESVLLKIGTRMGSVEIDALVDTGNRLHEPLSGLPVIIVGRKRLRGVLDESCLEKNGKRLPPGFRIVRYGALGGSGEMWCFRPESVCIWRNGAWTEVQDLWVAIYPGEIPSDVEALAPPIF